MEINECPSCGGKVEYSPKSKGLKCDKCQTIYPVQFEKAGEKKRVALALNNDKGFEQWKDSKRTFHCENCGAEIILNKFDYAEKCSYCNTTSLVPTDKLPGLKPDCVVPFKIEKDMANQQFKLSTQKKRFLPTAFKKNIPNAKIGATYIPSFAFDITIDATYHGMRAVSRTVQTANGPRTTTTLVPFSGSIHNDYKNVVVESSEQLSQSQIQGILPYNFGECFVYNDDFVTGYDIEYYNQTVSDANKLARTVVYNMTDSAIRSRHGNVRSLTIKPTYSNENYSYCLLPVYFVNYKYKEKEYFNLMNGQTGQTTGKVPRSATKITFFTLAIILLVIGLPLLIMLLASL